MTAANLKRLVTAPVIGTYKLVGEYEMIKFDMDAYEAPISD